jgi:CYTH domain-containing protein
VFAGENARLVIAEIELRDENEGVVLPPWAGLEVTGQDPYYNSSLAVHPFMAGLMRKGLRLADEPAHQLCFESHTA